MALHLPSGSLKTCSVLQLVPRCEPSTYQPISQWKNHCPIGAGKIAQMHLFINNFSCKFKTYCDYIPVYTDWWRDRSSLACTTVSTSDTIISMRLPDSASIFTAEICAIIKALEQIGANNKWRNDQKMERFFLTCLFPQKDNVLKSGSLHTKILTSKQYLLTRPDVNVQWRHVARE